jgi:hypothetical protein
VLKCAAGVAGAFGVPYLIPSGVLAADGKPGANERVTVGAIGVGGRASLLLDQLPTDGQLVALCDCNVPRAEAFKAKRKGDWPVYQHYQKILERKDIDAVIIATQEFQRVLPSIHACQAGKDVYAEKPLTLYVREGRVLVDTVRKHGRVFQVGSQQRTMAMNRIACELVRTGGLGKIIEVQAPCYPPWDCSRRSTKWKRNGSGVTRPPCGRPSGICRIGSTVSARGSSLRQTSRSAIGRSASAIWPTSPAGSDGV